MPYIEIENRVYNGPKYMDLGAPSGVVWESRFDLLPLSSTTNATELRSLLAASGLTLTRASAATVQTSSSTVVTSGIGVDDPRVGIYGLVLEEIRQNLVPSARDLNGTGWGAAGGGVVVTGGQSGPDGGSLATRHQVPSGQQTKSANVGATTAGVTYVLSQWHRCGTISPGQMTSFIGSLTATAPTSTTWERVSLTRTGGAVTFLGPCMGIDGSAVGGVAAGARDAYTDLHQVEAGTWASEAIITTGAAATRQPDRVLLDSASRVVRGGRATLNARMALKGSIGGSNDYSADPYLWRYDGSNYATINRTTGAITIVIAGASYTTASGFTASRGDVVDYWVEAGGGSLQSVVKARKSSDGGVTFGAVTTLGTSGAPQGTIPSAGPLDLLSNAGTAGHLSCWLQRFRAYAPGRRIAWAA